MLNQDSIRNTKAAWQKARKRASRSSGRAALVGILFMPATGVFAAAAADRAVAGAARYAAMAGFMLVISIPLCWMLWRHNHNEQARSDELMGALDRQLTEAVLTAELEAGRREDQIRRQQFEGRLASALEMAEGEPEVVEVIERALAGTLPDAPAELLLADNSHAHLSRMASSSPTGEPPRCSVDSPDHCPAARRAQLQRFEDSDALDACPKLRGRGPGRCSAVCVPVSIMGRTVGVIHATGEPNASMDENSMADLATLANLAGARIGLLRMMAESQLQAATDSLTGLLNRRSLENAVAELRAGQVPFALAMGDLDHFKELNDVFGHDTGDRALRLFAQTLRGALRRQDLVSRHGGEEFVAVLPRCSVEDARRALQGVRDRLAAAIAAGGLPKFTVSFGVVAGRPNDDLVDVVTRADVALFEAKHGGRDRIVTHDGPTPLEPSGPAPGADGDQRAAGRRTEALS